VSHMVIFRSTDGKSGYHQTEELDEAIRFVERLRNAEGVEQARIFRLEEVGFEFRPYYRVEVGAAGAAPVPGAGPVPVPAPVADGEPGEPVDGVEGAEGELLAANGKRGLFSR
jgi:hypothetical protein